MPTIKEVIKEWQISKGTVLLFKSWVSPPIQKVLGGMPWRGFTLKIYVELLPPLYLHNIKKRI